MSVVQFIDGAGEFAYEDTAHKGSLNAFLDEKCKFLSKGNDYVVVAILGPQSSGKSTLLNLLFQTSFDVLNTEHGRQQTTQGLWMGIAKMEESSKAILVMDVEGTDGRERGESEVAFERKTSLFSLAVASVLIINMWLHDIGRHNAAGIGLLKIVFELNLQLFLNSKATATKTLLLFVIRDYIKTHPIEKLKTTIFSDLNGVWKDIAKPAGFENTSLSDYFEVSFAFLPHKELQPEEFQQAGVVLRKRFTDPNVEDSALKPTFSKNIPADGFVRYANNVWEAVKSNQDLDIPSQKELLAEYRCEEISEASLATFEEGFKPLQHAVEQGELLKEYAKSASQLLEQALSSYTATAERYHNDIYARKKEALRKKCITSLEIVYNKLMEIARVKALANFRKEVAESLSNPKDDSDYVGTMDKIVKSALSFFEDVAKESTLADSGWSPKQAFETLRTAIIEESERLKRERLAQLVTEAKQLLEKNLASQLDRFLEQADSNMWTSIRSISETTSETTERDVSLRLKKYGLNEEQTKVHIADLHAYIPEGIKKAVGSKAKQLSNIMQRKFEAVFSYDDLGIPRHWSTKDDVPAIFKRSMAEARSLVERFAMLRLNESDDDVPYYFGPDGEVVPASEVKVEDSDERATLTREQCREAVERFRSSADLKYRQALNDQEASKTSGLNPLIIGLILVLGWNEFMMVISWILGPLLLPVLFIAGLIGYLLWQGQLGGPVARLAQTAFTSGISAAWNTASQYGQGLVNGRAATAAPHIKRD